MEQLDIKDRNVFGADMVCVLTKAKVSATLKR